MPQLPDWDLTPPFEMLTRAQPRARARPAATVEKRKVTSASTAQPSNIGSEKLDPIAPIAEEESIEADASLAHQADGASDAVQVDGSLDEDPQAQVQFCTECGNRLEEDAFFCSECGAAR